MYPTLYKFQLTRPARGATSTALRLYALFSDFNSHAPRGARRQKNTQAPKNMKISTHTPREGRDGDWRTAWHGILISTHTPREGRDTVCREIRRLGHDFNSHAPRGARQIISGRYTAIQYFNSHAPRGARRQKNTQAPKNMKISTHTPREGRDGDWRTAWHGILISTHTPREGRDTVCREIRRLGHDFNSHAPRGARQIISGRYTAIQYFNSHAPRGARRAQLIFVSNPL